MQDRHRPRRGHRVGHARVRADRVPEGKPGPALGVADAAHGSKTGSIRDGGTTCPAGLASGPVLLGLVLLSFNLRPAAVSVGPVLDEVRAGLGMSAAAAGLLTPLPVIAFAVFGALGIGGSPAVRSAPGHGGRAVAAAVGLVGRALVDDQAPFLALSLLALGGMAMADVLIPSLVKRH